jgi:tRNA U34 5-carboxymethylaminomethyl modifying GTPase MnmE/TrmE
MPSMGASQPMSDLREIEDLLDLCMARTEGVLAEQEWDDLADLKGSVRMRRGFVGEILAVALAGATGSGKSSILNALCGKDIAPIGVLRPTTSRSLAAVPRGSTSNLGPFVDLLGVDDTVEVDSLRDVVIVDLPDMDSRVRSHRIAVEEALSVIDAVVWVLDPEKYADRVIHEEFLTPMSQYGDQFIFCLNKVDRLGADVGEVTDSLKRHLMNDGYPNPEIVTSVAVSDGDGESTVKSLADALDRRFDHKRTAQMKVAMDVQRFASRCWRTLDAQLEQVSGADRDLTAVALGIAALGLHHDLSEAAGS